MDGIVHAQKRAIVSGYPAAYYRRPLEEQIAVLRKLRPQLNLGSRIKELEDRERLFGSEGTFAILKWESIAASYSDALEKWIFPVLASLPHSGLYYGSRFDALGPDYMRQHKHTEKAFAKLNAEQDGDILVIQAQFGAHHRARAPLFSRKVYMLNEFGLTTFAVACMLLTHPSRVGAHTRLWVDCPGDEYRHVYSKEFNHTPAFLFYGGKIFFSTYSNDADFRDSASVTGFHIK
ncbi:MAG: hypothetical protein Q8R30_00070 [bacterium]|nr:hypothetical protein [bacterium]